MADMCLFPSHKAAREDATSRVIENGMEKVLVPELEPKIRA